tara:strand:+ start:1784 stop:1951 length:168 start_codon:yes stop_codon:yes gene_type:complete
MDYGEILICIENIIESIEFGDVELIEVKSKLQELTIEIENGVDIDHGGLEGYDFE